MKTKENMSYYKAAKHIAEFSVNLKNYTFGKKCPVCKEIIKSQIWSSETPFKLVLWPFS